MSDVLPANLLEPAAERFRVLGDATRLQLIRTLMNEGEMNVGDLVERLDASQANISKHLRILHQAGVVARRPEGTSAYYSVSDPSLGSLCSIVCDRITEQARADAEALAQ